METNFLRLQSTKSLQREIRNIVDSYSHPWDILAELCQNSVDAIKKWEKKNPGIDKKHEITIVINQKERSIRIIDNGVGFDPEKVASLLAPNETDKDEDDLIGEKGVGLTFVIFSSNGFSLDTKSVKGSYSCKIRNADNWVNGSSIKDEDVPKIDNPEVSFEKNKPGDTYTDIKIEDVQTIDEGLDIFELTLTRIEHLLRTKTAIGYTGRKFNKGNLEISVILKVITPDGKELNPTNISFDYWFPDEFFSKKDVVDFDDFLDKAPTLSDRQKSKKLSGKCMVVQGSETKAGRDYRYFGFFVPTRRSWIKSAKDYRLLDGSYSSRDVEDIPIDAADVQPGIFVSTRGMPTGIELTPPATGTMGYWPHLFILIENDSFKFDVGRKSIPGRSQPPIKDIAKKKFDDLSKWKQWLAKDKTPDIKPPELHYLKRKNEFDEIKKFPNLNFDEINYIKYPGEQEAAVVAIFHELIGAGLLIGYHGLAEGYKKNYDFWGKYKISKDKIGEKYQEEIEDIFEKDIVVEFKYDASGVIDDVEENKKFFIDMDLLVCWDINREKFAKNNIDVELIPKEEIVYYGSNYYLEFPGTYDLGQQSRKPIISLKAFIEELKKE